MNNKLCFLAKKLNLLFIALCLLCYGVLGMAENNYRGDGKALIGIGHYLIQRPEKDELTPHWAYKISFVLPGSAAFKGGLQAGDELLSWDGHTLDNISTKQRSSALRDYLKQQKRVGEELHISFVRYSMQIGDSTPTISHDIKNQWLSYLQHPQKNLSKHIQLTYHADKIDKTITLGKRRDDVTLPPQEQLLKKITTSLSAQKQNIDLAHPLYALPQTLISTFNLNIDYADLLERYEQDEKWQQSFINKTFQYTHRSPFDLLPITEHISQTILQRSEQNHQTLLTTLAHQLMPPPSFHNKRNWHIPIPTSPDLSAHTHFINQILENAHTQRQAAFQALTEDEITQLTEELPQLMKRFANSYYIHQSQDETTIHINQQNSTVLDLLKKVNLSAFFTSAKILLQLTDKKWLETLNHHAPTWLERTTHHTHDKRVLGRVISSYESTYGKVIIGSKDNNIYTQAATLIIDLGGNDKYYGANAPAKHPITFLLDYAGNDLYSSTVEYAQAATLLGVSLLFDYAGDDRYLASYYAQGTAIGGVAMLYDEQGNDRYIGQRFAQGVGFWGAGILHDKAGNDEYSAWRYAQGTGGVNGIGVLIDKQGSDHYRATGESRSSYGTNGNFQSSSQGFGVGFRGYAPGGTGILIDGAGTDYYEAGNFAQGVGYFFALGILRDFGDDDDTYHASRYGLGASAHSAAGAFIDDGGDDYYTGNHIALLGSAWDLSLAAFWDKKGDDTYRQTARGFSIGVAAHNGHSVFLDSSGKDNYQIDKKQLQAPKNNYHGGNSFAFFIDAGGEQDNYNQGKFNNNSLLYEYNHAFMLDLPIPLNAQTKNIFWQVLP